MSLYDAAEETIEMSFDDVFSSCRYIGNDVIVDKTRDYYFLKILRTNYVTRSFICVRYAFRGFALQDAIVLVKGPDEYRFKYKEGQKPVVWYITKIGLWSSEEQLITAVRADDRSVKLTMPESCWIKVEDL